MRILIIGAAGFIGSHVVEQVINAGYSATCYDIFIPQADINKADWIVGSAADEAILRSAACGCDIAIYLVGGSLPNSTNADMAGEINSHVRTAVKAAEICRDAHVKKFIFASSGGTVYGYGSEQPLREDMYTQPITAYGASKLAIEHYIRIISGLYGMKTISLRLSNPYGERQKSERSQGFVAAAMLAAQTGSELSVWGDGSVVRDFIYVGDVAKAFVSACSYSGDTKVFNIGSGEGRSLNEMIAIIERYCNASLNTKYESNRKIDVKSNILNIENAKTELSWEPITSIEQGIGITADWWANKI